MKDKDWKVTTEGRAVLVREGDENKEAICHVFPQRDKNGAFTNEHLKNAIKISATKDMHEALTELMKIKKSYGIALPTALKEKLERALKKANGDKV